MNETTSEVAPHWVQHPEIPFGSIGWRMGYGEGTKFAWGDFTETLRTRADRLEHLSRYPAPYPFARSVWRLLAPETEQISIHELERLKLVASDVSYRYWCSPSATQRAPWAGSATPEAAVRYGTREFWFWGRRHAENLLGNATTEWPGFAASVESQDASNLNPNQGLLTMARQLWTGTPAPPWLLGLSPDSFGDTFDDDMGYVDAYRLWGMECIDDDEQLATLVLDDAPAKWRDWIAEHMAPPKPWEWDS